MGYIVSYSILNKIFINYNLKISRIFRKKDATAVLAYLILGTLYMIIDSVLTIILLVFVPGFLVVTLGMCFWQKLHKILI